MKTKKFLNLKYFSMLNMQVAPSELEHLLLTHPQIADAAVIGLPDEMAGELPRAFVVKKANAQITEAQVAEFINGNH